MLAFKFRPHCRQAFASGGAGNKEDVMKDQQETKCLHTQSWSVEQLKPYAGNPRQHDNRQIARIADSIREFGLNRAVLIDPDGQIIAGHALWLAARRLGFSEIPVVVLNHLSDAQKQAFRIADNQLALGSSWDEALLRTELARLQEMSFDIGLLGFAERELEDLLGDLRRQMGTGDEHLVPELPREAVNCPGDLWEMQGHRLLCGDAVERAALERLMEGEQANLIFTDPPYNVNYEQRTRGNSARIRNDDLGSGFEPFLKIVCRNLLAVCAGAVYICMSSSELHTLHRAFTEAGGHWSTFIIWAKNTFTLGRSDYQRQYEPILYGWKEGQTHHWCGARDQGDVWFVDRPVRNDLHPTMKPVELVERAVRNSSDEGQLVLDPFGGSGSTLIAAEKNRRRARLIELDPAYADVIVERWQQYTGAEARLAATGRSFAEMRTERRRSAA